MEKQINLKIQQIKKQKFNLILLGLIFIAFLFLRFYQLEIRTIFGCDQVNNAWVAKSIIVDHQFPLLGMVAKASTGFYIGPAYYYLISIFYWIFNLDPIASGVFAGVTAIFTFFTIFYITKRIFSTKIALIATFIYTFSGYIIISDKNQWPVNFITPISLIIFYALLNILRGKPKYLLLLGFALGFSFHIHFTSVFYIIIILLSFPFFPRKIETLKYCFISLLLFLIWLIPNFIAELNTKNVHTNNMFNYVSTYYHGFHLTRFMQVAKDAFIEFDAILFNFQPLIKSLKYFFIPFFVIVYFVNKPSRDKFNLCYLVALWFLIPWLVFSAYKGEISDYYFSLTIPIVILIASYLVYKLLEFKNLIYKAAVIIFILFFLNTGIQQFLYHKDVGLKEKEENVKAVISKGGYIGFQECVPESYLYYFLSTRKNK